LWGLSRGSELDDIGRELIPLARSASLDQVLHLEGEGLLHGALELEPHPCRKGSSL